VVIVQHDVEYFLPGGIEVNLREFEHNDVLALLFDWDIVPKILGMVSFRLVQDLIVRVDPLYAQLLAEVRSDSGDVGQRIALVNDALNVGVGVSAGVDGVYHISDVEASSGGNQGKNQ